MVLFGLFMGAIGFDQRGMHPLLLQILLPSEFLARVSDQLHLSDERSGNETKLGAVLRSPGIYHMAEENPRKLQLGDHLKAV